MIVVRLLTSRVQPDRAACWLPSLVAYSAGMHLAAYLIWTLLHQFSLDLAIGFGRAIVVFHGFLAGSIVTGKMPLLPRSRMGAATALAMVLIFVTPWLFVRQHDATLVIEYLTIALAGTLALLGWDKLRKPIRQSAR